MDKNYITNDVLTAAGLGASSTTTSNIKTTNTVLYKIDGNVYSLASNANITQLIPSTITVPAGNTGSIGVYVNPNGTITYVQGTNFSNGTLASVNFYGLQGSSTTLMTTQTTISTYSTIGLPQEKPGNALIGWVIINSTNTSVYTGGTTALNGSGGFTVSFIDKFGFVGL